MNEYLDLCHPITVDTILCVKFGSNKWANYNIPIKRANGTERTFGDLYHYFSNQKDFRFAKGLIRIDDSLTSWIGKSQYFYFSKEEPPFIDVRELSTPINVLKVY